MLRHLNIQEAYIAGQTIRIDPLTGVRYEERDEHEGDDWGEGVDH